MLQSLDQAIPSPATDVDEDARRKRIRELNDMFRQQRLAQAFTFGRIVKTPGIAAMSWADQYSLMEAVKRFDTFNADNDPHSEHDFGSLDFKGHKVFWKIDYYDCSLKHASPDASDAAITARVLTVMLASEY